MFSIKLVLTLLLIAFVAVSASCGLFGDSTTDSIVNGGQSWSGRNWTVEFNSAEWSGCTIAVTVTITNTGNAISNFGYTDTGAQGYLYVIDKYGQIFEPFKQWFWSDQFYDEKFYPDESRSGTLEYKIDPRSEHIQMQMNPGYQEVQGLVFDLGDVPPTCE